MIYLQDILSNLRLNIIYTVLTCKLLFHNTNFAVLYGAYMFHNEVLITIVNGIKKNTHPSKSLLNLLCHLHFIIAINETKIYMLLMITTT